MSIVNREMRLPIISIPSPAGNIMPTKVLILLRRERTFVPYIDLILLDRRLYLKDLIVRLSTTTYPYLIFVQKREMKKKELESKQIKEKEVMIYEFSFYSGNRKIRGVLNWHFSRRYSIGELERTWNGVSPTNLEEVNMDLTIPRYKVR
ncbi:MAG: hypothetical protein QXT48_05000 [Thermoplasmatales archaeon]